MGPPAGPTSPPTLPRRAPPVGAQGRNSRARAEVLKMTSGSQKRKTTAQIKVNCTPAQKAAIVDKAGSAGLSPAAICLAMLLDAPLPKARKRRTRNNEAFNAYLAAAQKLTDALKASVAEMNKEGSNLNQVSHAVNAAMLTERPLASLAAIVESAIEEHRAVLARHKQIFDDLDEIRTVAMDVWGER
jgi:hypothetical protein